MYGKDGNDNEVEKKRAGGGCVGEFGAERIFRIRREVCVGGMRATRVECAPKGSRVGEKRRIAAF